MKRYASVASQLFSINKPQSQENNAYIFKLRKCTHLRTSVCLDTRLYLWIGTNYSVININNLYQLSELPENVNTRIIETQVLHLNYMVNVKSTKCKA